MNKTEATFYWILQGTEYAATISAMNREAYNAMATALMQHLATQGVTSVDCVAYVPAFINGRQVLVDDGRKNFNPESYARHN